MAGVIAMMAGLGVAGKFFSQYPKESTGVPSSVPSHMRPNSNNIFESDMVRTADATVINESSRRMEAASADGSRMIPPQFNSIGRPDSRHVLGPLGAEQSQSQQEFDHHRWLLQQNMVPFYKGLQSRQPVHNINEANPNLERFTQDSSEAVVFKPPKREVLSMYETSQVQNVFPGMRPDQTYAKLNQAKGAVSRVSAQGVPLTDPIHVGPGLTGKPDAEPSGGRHPMFRPTFKSVNQLRTVGDHQKITMRGRVLPGQKGSRRGKVGAVGQNRPDTAYIPIAPVPTRSEVSGDMAKTFETDPTAVPLTSREMRRDSNQNDLQGPAAVASGGREGERATYVLAPARNLYLEDQHGVGQTGKVSQRRPEHVTADDFLGSKWAQPRPVVEERISNPHNALTGSLAPVYDPDDVYQTTKRETSTDQAIQNILSGAGLRPDQRQVRLPLDPQDRPEQTMRAVDEANPTYFQHAQTGNLRSDVGKRTMKDPNDVPDWTQRGTPNDPLATALVAGPQRSVISTHDEEFQRTQRDLVEARVQTAAQGGMPYSVFMGQGDVGRRGVVKDPEDLPSFRQQQGDTDGMSFAVIGSGDQARQGMAHDRSVKTWVKPRQNVQVLNYAGGARQDRGSGYMAARWEQKYTQRQNMSGFMFKPARSSVDQLAVTNASTFQVDNCHKKEGLLKTQAPTLSGPKEMLSTEQVRSGRFHNNIHQNTTRASIEMPLKLGAAIQSIPDQPTQQDLNSKKTQSMPDRFLLPVANENINVPGISSTPLRR
jgi:hypothetical protein